MSKPDEGNRWFWLWDVYFGAVLLLVVLMVLHEDGFSLVRRVSGAVALCTGAACYALWGRRRILAEAPPTPLRVFLGVEVGLYFASVLLVPSNSMAMFALSPIIFMCLSARPAIVVFAVCMLIPTVAVLADAGSTSAFLSLLAGSLAITLMGSTIGLYIDWVDRQSEERKRLIGELERSRAEVARLSHDAGSAAERERLAREIHDTLAQGFTSIVTLTQAAESEVDSDPAAARRHLELAARTARENLAEARAMVTALTPPALGDGSLEEAIRREAGRLATESGPAVTCTIGALPALPTASEVVLLRAAQEAITNVRRHSGATTVDIELSTTEDRVRLVVADNGTGFRTDTTDGFGLRGMRARVEQVGGTMSVRSGPNEGTRVEVEVSR